MLESCGFCIRVYVHKVCKHVIFYYALRIVWRSGVFFLFVDSPTDFVPVCRVPQHTANKRDPFANANTFTEKPLGLITRRTAKPNLTAECSANDYYRLLRYYTTRSGFTSRCALFTFPRPLFNLHRWQQIAPCSSADNYKWTAVQTRLYPSFWPPSVRRWNAAGNTTDGVSVCPT